MNMMEQIWKVRDSRGLDIYEKNFLMTIASRGEAGMFCEWKRNTDDMGMKKDRYYKTRKALLDKGLITAQEQPFGPTIYKINDASLTEWCTTHSVTQNDILPDRKRHSVTQNGHSVTPERKKNIKKNKEEELTEELDSVAGAPSLALDKNKNDKDEEDSNGAPRHPASLIGSTSEVSLIDDNEEEGAGAAVRIRARFNMAKGGIYAQRSYEWNLKNAEQQLGQEAEEKRRDDLAAARAKRIEASKPKEEELVW